MPRKRLIALAPMVSAFQSPGPGQQFSLSRLLTKTSANKLPSESSDDQIGESSFDYGLLDRFVAMDIMNPEGMYLNSKLGIVPSNELVDCDSFGRPLFRPGHRDFVYVDELACVGCKLCTGVAPATFFMEPHDGNGE